MKYLIGKKYVTEPKHSVDGKRHVRTTYYAGTCDVGLGMQAQMWEKKQKALRFITKRQAQTVLRRLKEDGAYIIPVKEGKK